MCAALPLIFSCTPTLGLQLSDFCPAQMAAAQAAAAVPLIAAAAQGAAVGCTPAGGAAAAGAAEQDHPWPDSDGENNPPADNILPSLA